MKMISLLVCIGLILLVANESLAQQETSKRNLRSATATTAAYQGTESFEAKATRRELMKNRDLQGNATELYGPGSNFYVAESLDFFKNMDPLWFEWINPDEIQPGGTTCGFLYPDLGLLDYVTYPIISVYVCMRFANIQPAAKGNMFVHCGGPGSLSDCIDVMLNGGFFSDLVLDEYNLISIDQVWSVVLTGAKLCELCRSA